MSKYTTEVRYICETNAGLTESAGYSSIKDILQEAAPKIFDFDFPIFDESYRLPLEIKILRHYYTREICEETVGLWKLRLEDRMNMIMPFYNKLYESELLSFNPMYNVDLTRDHVKQNDGTSNSQNITNSTYSNDINKTDKQEIETNIENKESGLKTDNIIENATTETNDMLTNKETGTITDTISGSSSKDVDTESNNTETGNNTTIGNVHTTENEKTDTDNKGWNLYSDTPQGGVSGIDNFFNDNVGNNAYLTNATRTTSEGEQNTDTEGNANSTETSNNTTETTGKISSNEQVSNSSENERVFDKKTTDDKTGTVTSNNNSTSTGITNNTETSNTNTTLNDNAETSENGSENRFNSGTNMINSTEDYLEHVKGKTAGASYSKMLTEFRETFLNIDANIIEELKDLFLGLW